MAKLCLACVCLMVISLMFVGQSSARIDNETIVGIRSLRSVVYFVPRFLMMVQGRSAHLMRMINMVLRTLLALATLTISASFACVIFYISLALALCSLIAAQENSKNIQGEYGLEYQKALDLP